MAQMSITARATGFGAHHAVAAIDHFLDGTGLSSLPKAGPATSGVKFGARFEQEAAAADAVITTVLPVVFIFAREGAFRGGEIGRAHV